MNTIELIRDQYRRGKSATQILAYIKDDPDGHGLQGMSMVDLILEAFQLDVAKIQLVIAWEKPTPDLTTEEIDYLLSRSIEENRSKWDT